jgi:tetratricopeptide (TPR) repeat protein
MILARWLEDPRIRRTGLLVGGVVLAAAVLTAAGWFWYRSQEERGDQALAQAIVLVQEATAPSPPPDARGRAIQALEAVLNEHPRYSGAAQASYLLGNLRYAAGQYAPARAAYELTLAKGAAGTLRAESALGVGYTWEADKDYAKAVNAYDSAAKRLAPQDFLYEETLVALARAQELGGQRAAAIETYQRLLKDVPETRRAEDLRTRLAALRSQPK